MLEAITMGFDETTLAYDLQRAHSADVWFLRARFYFWGVVAAISSFIIGQLCALFGYNVLLSVWEGFWNLVHHI
tara:strand:+ start:10975 stop:11196 length:222 start_codon:yes stop_codon:yes gene_type:complete